MKFKNIHFIINPISGKGKGKEVIRKIYSLFPKENIKIKITQKKQDAFDFTIQSVHENADLIVSCGGDGTLNEVASALINQEVPLAIVPIGSGNGLARHLNISLNEEQALQNILNSKYNIEKIDCGKINDTYFFSNAGLGFDATVVKIYSQQKQRQFVGYLKCLFFSIFKYEPIKISVNSKSINYTGKIMMLNISNSNCMGYGFSISPKASLQDGEFDINLVEKCSWAMFSWIGISFLLNKKLSKKRRQFNSSQLTIETSAKYMQIDGEYHILNSKRLQISLISNSLNVLVN